MHDLLQAVFVPASYLFEFEDQIRQLEAEYILLGQ